MLPAAVLVDKLQAGKTAMKVRNRNIVPEGAEDSEGAEDAEDNDSVQTVEFPLNLIGQTAGFGTH
jgi:hypothetical protein